MVKLSVYTRKENFEDFFYAGVKLGLGLGLGRPRKKAKSKKSESAPRRPPVYPLVDSEEREQVAQMPNARQEEQERRQGHQS